MYQNGQPTPYDDLNAVLELLLERTRFVLEKRLVGLILSGSLASGDFDPQRSDIDFVVVTGGELPVEMLLTMEEMHTSIRFSGMKWVERLEGSYIPLRDLRRYDPVHSNYPALRVDGSFGVDGHGSDSIIQRYILREYGIPLYGPEPRSLIEPILPEELLRAEGAILDEWWAPQVLDPFRMYTREYQAYAVLTMCRALYMWEFNAVVSKPVAAHWAQGALGQRFYALIERALTWQEDDGVQDLEATVGLIQYTLGCYHLPVFLDHPTVGSV